MCDSGDRPISGAISFFVCGTISNRQGFDYVDLGPQKLPGTPSLYLDVPEEGASDNSRNFERVDVDGDPYVRYSRYCRINPNDADYNRGAYLAAGFLCSRRLTWHEATNCIDLTSEIFGRLKAHIGPQNQVDSGFRLAQFSYDTRRLQAAVDSHSSALLALDLLMQALNAEGSRHWEKTLWVDPAKLTQVDDMREYLFYFREGVWDAQLSIDSDRERLRFFTERLLESASLADQVHDQWLSYQAMISEHLPATLERGTELRDVLEELERLSGSLDLVESDEPATPSAGFAAGGSGKARTGAAPSARDGAPVGSPSALGPRSEAPSDHRRGRSANSRRRQAPLRLRLAVAGGVVVLAAAILVGALQLLDHPGPEGSVTVSDSPGQQAPVRSGQAGRAGDAPSDVARERAALNERPGDGPAAGEPLRDGAGELSTDGPAAGEPPTDEAGDPATNNLQPPGE